MDRRYFELEEDMQEPQKTTFEKKRDMIEERFTILKNDMHTLRMSVQQTTNEVKGVYQHVMKLQNVVDNVSENVKIQLHESKIFRERKVMEYRQLLEKSKRVLDESKSLVQAFEHVKQNRKRQHIPVKSFNCQTDNKKYRGTNEGMWMDDEQPGCSGYQYNGPQNFNAYGDCKFCENGDCKNFK